MIYILTDHEDNNSISAVILCDSIKCNPSAEEIQNVIYEAKEEPGYTCDIVDSLLRAKYPGIKIFWTPDENFVRFLEW